MQRVNLNKMRIESNAKITEFYSSFGFDPRKPTRKKPIDPIYKKGA